MTFEDYKKQFELFSKIDTAEKLAFCQQQYENHLLHVEDENYFEPYENRSGSNLLSQYEQNLNQIFGLDNIQENQFYLLVRPSFEPEYLMVITKQQNYYLLIHRTLIKNYWSEFYTDRKVTTIDSKIIEYELTKAIGDNFFSLLDKIMAEARLPRGQTFTLDGVVYLLLKISENKIKSVFKHSPSKESKSGKVISLIEYLIANINMLNDNTLDDIIEAKIDEIK